MRSTKRVPFILLFVICRCHMTQGASSEIRTWTDKQGRTIEATLINYDSTKAIGSFRRADGRVVDIPRGLLATADQNYLDTQSFASEPQAPQEAEEPTEEQSESYTFSGLSKTSTDGYINTNEGWEYQVKALRAKVRYRSENSPSNQQYVRAYFYDRNNQLIQSYKSPARTQDKDGKYFDPPQSYEEGERYEVYFPLSEFLENRNWQRAIVVFGDARQASAKIYPSGDLSAYDFPERKLIFGSNLDNHSSKSADVEPTTFVISDAGKSTYKSTAWVDGDWRDGTKGILVRVKVEDALPKDKYFLRVHYFDEKNQLIITHNEPTQIEADNESGIYTQLPKFARLGRRHDAYFPFDQEVENSDWRKAVVVFGNKQSVDIAIVRGSPKDLEILDFPEKAQYSK